MKPLKFIHCADIHLGTPFGSASEMPSEAARILRESPRLALKQIIDSALENEVDFVLIAGDIFDGPVIDLRELRFFTSQLEKINEKRIPCYAICGNHDPLSIWPEHWSFPSNFHLFGKEISRVEVKKDDRILAEIVGFSYPEKEVPRKSLKGYAGKTIGVPVIGMLHTAMTSSPDRYVPCSREELVKLDLDFWALGHVHQRREICDDNPVIAWSGAPQKLNPNETGAGGFYFVEMSADGRFRREFITVDSTRFFELEIDASTCNALEDLPVFIANAARNAVAGENINAVMRIQVRGRCGFSGDLRRGTRTEEIIELTRDILARERPFIHLDVMELNIRGRYAIEAMIEEQSLPGDIAAAAKAAKDDPIAFANEVKTELDPLFVRWKNSRLLEYPSEDELASLAAEAAGALLDRLLEGTDE